MNRHGFLALAVVTLLLAGCAQMGGATMTAPPGGLMDISSDGQRNMW